MVRPVGLALTACLVAAAIGCSSPNTTRPVATNTTTAPTAGNPCAQAKFTPQQFTGDWNPGDPASIWTLNADGTLKSTDKNEPNKNESGTWSYAPWGLTPGKSSMPHGQENHCVLWLHWAEPGTPMDLLYDPLEVSDTTLKLSYIGRGNTLTFTRPKPAS